MKNAAPNVQRKPWFLRHSIYFLLLVNILILIGAECTVRVLAHYGVIHIALYRTNNPSEQFMGDINEHFGVWHYPNRTVRVASPCFSVEYRSNSYGARDHEVSQRSSAACRVVVLGDSFVEGYGVNVHDRMTDIAERISGVEFLNFGVSGNFGTIQQWLLYREIASKFDHSEIALFFLPANDFDDNNPAHFSAKRYRPYLKKNAEEKFELYYTVPFPDRDQTHTMDGFRAFRRELYRRIYLLNVLRQLGDLFERSEVKSANRGFDQESRYQTYAPEDLERVIYSFRQIAKQAGDRMVNIIVIPRLVDFLEAAQGSRIIEDLQRFAASEKNVQVVDLLPVFQHYMRQNRITHTELFLPCDGHWSPLGNQVASTVLAKTVAECGNKIPAV
jgi:hypothetical protein